LHFAELRCDLRLLSVPPLRDDKGPRGIDWCEDRLLRQRYPCGIHPVRLHRPTRMRGFFLPV